MVHTPLYFESDMSKGIQRVRIAPLMMTGNNKAHAFQVAVSPAGSLEDCTVSGAFVRADGVTVELEGTVDGDVAIVWLVKDCYRVPGRAVLTINATWNDRTASFLCAEMQVMLSSTETIANPDETIVNLEEIRAQYATMQSVTENTQQAANNANTATTKANTATTNANTATANANKATNDARALTNAIQAKLDAGELKGDKGDKGDKGEKGDRGEKGETGSIDNMDANTVEAVAYGMEQSLTDAQRSQARKNIGAVTYESEDTTAEQRATLRDRYGLLANGEAQDLTDGAISQVLTNLKLNNRLVYTFEAWLGDNENVVIENFTLPSGKQNILVLTARGVGSVGTSKVNNTTLMCDGTIVKTNYYDAAAKRLTLAIGKYDWYSPVTFIADWAFI